MIEEKYKEIIRALTHSKMSTNISIGDMDILNYHIATIQNPINSDPDSRCVSIKINTKQKYYQITGIKRCKGTNKIYFDNVNSKSTTQVLEYSLLIPYYRQYGDYYRILIRTGGKRIQYIFDEGEGCYFDYTGTMLQLNEFFEQCSIETIRQAMIKEIQRKMKWEDRKTILILSALFVIFLLFIIYAF